MKTPIFIDTDMGVDDILAICLLVLSGNYSILGVSLVNGVATTKAGAKNALRLLKALDIKAPVFIGVSQKEQNSSVQFPTSDRLRANQLRLITSIQLPESPSPSYEFNKIPELFRNIKKPIPILCLGPLSNIRLCIKKQSIKNKIKNLVIMGGAVYVSGNVNPSYTSEYNIRLDPKAASEVFSTNLPILLTPMDATKGAPAILTNNKANNSSDLQKFLSWLKSYTPMTKPAVICRDIILNNLNDFSSFYDPLAVLVYIDPSIVRTQIKGRIAVSTDKKTYGKTQYVKNVQNQTTTILTINSKRFYAVFKKMLQNKP